MKYDGYLGSVDFCLESQCIHGKLLFIDDVISYEAENLTDLQVEFEAAVDDYRETCKQLGREAHTPCKGSFNVRVGSDLHKEAAVKARLEGVSLNDYVKSAIQEKLSQNGLSNKVHHLHVHQIEVPQQHGTFDFNEYENTGEGLWQKPKVKNTQLKVIYSSNQRH